MYIREPPLLKFWQYTPVINGLNNELCADLVEQVAENNIEEDLTDDELTANLSTAENETTPEIKKGIKLLKHDSEWSTANEYFKSTLPLNGPIKSHEFDASIQELNNTIYDYFARIFGHIETIPDKNLENRYKDHTVKDLKKALKCLKLSTNSDITEIKYASRVLRDKLHNNSDTQQDQSFNHDKYLQRNFWGYVKNVLTSKRTVLFLIRSYFRQKQPVTNTFRQLVCSLVVVLVRPYGGGSN